MSDTKIHFLIEHNGWELQGQGGKLSPYCVRLIRWLAQVDYEGANFSFPFQSHPSDLENF